jgi:hypothetical protein
MNYLKIYCNIVRKAENRILPEGYTEKHHTFPKSIFGKNSRIVVLTGREHYISHALLEKICIQRYGIEDKRTIKMTTAFVLMKNRSEKYNSYLYESSKSRLSLYLKNRIVGEEHRRKLSEASSGKNNPNYGKRGKDNPFYGKYHSTETKRKQSEVKKGKKRSEESKRKQSESVRGENHCNYGKSRSEETKRKISKARKGQLLSEETKRKIGKSKKGKYAGENHPMYGKTHSEETKRKQSEAKKGKKWWNDGCGNSKRAVECPGEGWVLGRKLKQTT